MKLVYLLITLAIFVGLIIGLSVYNNNTPKENSIPTFEDFSVQSDDIYTAKPAPANLESNPIGQTFRTRITEGAQEGPNFAGHYTVIEWGCGTMCSQFVIVDAEDGEIFNPGGVAEIGLSYRLDSRLLIVNPPQRVADIYSGMLPPEWAFARYLEWKDEQFVSHATTNLREYFMEENQ